MSSASPAGRSHRGRLLRGLTDIYFLRAGRHSDVELFVFDVLIELVLAKVEPIARIELAHRLAGELRPPPRVLMWLATDDIEVATPILYRSPALSDADLQQMARWQPQAHLAVIASRQPLATCVTDVLVARGEGPVIECMLQNTMARLSREGIQRLRQREDIDGDVLRLLVGHPDAPEDIAARLSPMIRDAVHEALGLLDAGMDAPMEEHLVEGSRAALAQRLRQSIEPAAAGSNPHDLFRRGLVSLDDAIIDLADAGREDEVAALIAPRLAMSGTRVRRVILGPREEGVAILCRAARLNANGFSAVLRMRRRHRQDASLPAEALGAFAALNVEAAQRAVAIYKERQVAKADGAPPPGQI